MRRAKAAVDKARQTAQKGPKVPKKSRPNDDV